MKTLSITWMIPFVAMTSAFITQALFTQTAEPLMRIRTRSS